MLLISYVLVFTLLPRELSNKTVLALHFIHALGWCLFHSFGLGLLLQGQSKNKMLVRHFLKHYPYPQRPGFGKSSSLAKAAATEAFENWKRLYNLSLCMSYSRCPIGARYSVRLLMRGLSSLIPGSCLENVLNPQQLDGRNRTTETHSWGCKSRVRCYVPSLVDRDFFYARLSSVFTFGLQPRVWKSLESSVLFPQS